VKNQGENLADTEALVAKLLRLFERPPVQTAKLGQDEYFRRLKPLPPVHFPS
jgi:hydroxyacyl-ACP dehydratase HTD2-like protein with hotdog domain